jgi:hypothetical protein
MDVEKDKVEDQAQPLESEVAEGLPSVMVFAAVFIAIAGLGVGKNSVPKLVMSLANERKEPGKRQMPTSDAGVADE